MKSASHTFGNKLKVRSLIDSYDSKLALKLIDGSEMIIKIVLEPSSELVKMCLMCFRYLSGSSINHIMWMLWRSAYVEIKYADEWEAFVAALLSLIFPFSEGHSVFRTKLPNYYLWQNVFMKLQMLTITCMILFHISPFAFNSRRNKIDSTKAKCLNNINLLLCQLTTWMGWPALWIKYSIKPENIDPNTRFLLALILEAPPNLLRSLASLFTNNIVRYLTFSQLVEETETVDLLVTPRTFTF